MTITVATVNWSYDGDGVTGDFAYDNKIFAKTDLLFYVDGVEQTIDVDYTVTGVGLPNGGVVHALSPPGAGSDNVVILSNIPATQPLIYPGGGPFSGESHETALDRDIRVSQQLQDALLRALRLDDSEIPVTLNRLPGLADRIGKILGFDALGQPVAVAGEVDASLVSTFGGTVIMAADAATLLGLLNVSSFIQTLLTAANAAAARSTTGAQQDVVTTRGDLVRGSGAGVAERLALGALGYLPMSDGADIRYVEMPAGQRNLLRNPQYWIAQRTVPIAGIGATKQYHVDGHYMGVAGSPQARWTVDRETSGGPAGSPFWMSHICTTAEAAVAAGELQVFAQIIEAHELQHLKWGTAAAKGLTLKVPMLIDPDAGSGLAAPFTLGIAVHSPDGPRSYIEEVEIAAAATWQDVTVTVPGDVAGTINADSGPGLVVNVVLLGGSDWTATAGAWAAGEDYTTANQDNLADAAGNVVGIGRWQLETGDVATAFDPVDYWREFERCQTWLRRIANSHPTDTLPLVWGYAASTSTFQIQGVLPGPPMRGGDLAISISAETSMQVEHAAGTADKTTVQSIAGANAIADRGMVAMSMTVTVDTAEAVVGQAGVLAIPAGTNSAILISGEP